jgi:phosphate transport system ATP-binding protein
VRDNQVEIELGKITGFIGPSGYGKSAVLRSLDLL